MPCGNFHPVNEHGDKQGHVSQVFGGDTFVNLYSHQKNIYSLYEKICS